MTPLLEINLTAGFREGAVLNEVSFTVHAGESFGLVGESGAGKSTVSLAILGLLRFTGGWTAGTVRWRGRNLLELSERQMRSIRGREIALVPQSPAASLNPLLSVEQHFREAWRVHAAESWTCVRERIPELLASVQLDPAGLLRKYPGELSVGMAQRLVIALALLHRPALLIADEPTSALDPITQAEVLRLFQAAHQAGAAILYISHDLPSVAKLCDRIAILYRGQIVEQGDRSRVFESPAHPYAHRLVQAIASWPPGVDADRPEGYC